jgi:DNA-binding NarL/FixJ family response regulator
MFGVRVFVMRTQAITQKLKDVSEDELPAKIARASLSNLVPETDQGLPALVLIDPRALFRECVAYCLAQRWKGELSVIAVPSIEAWTELSQKVSASLILIWTTNDRQDRELRDDISLLCEISKSVPSVVISDTEELDHISATLDHGARGFIPTNLSFDVAVEAMRFVKAGGTFVPATSFVTAQRLSHDAEDRQKSSGELFTSRQAAVIEALRMGKPNKSIAYELNMCESTVKVHVRNIMKKLKAKNRTQVAFMANKMLG